MYISNYEPFIPLEFRLGGYVTAFGKCIHLEIPSTQPSCLFPFPRTKNYWSFCFLKKEFSSTIFNVSSCIFLIINFCLVASYNVFLIPIPPSTTLPKSFSLPTYPNFFFSLIYHPNISAPLLPVSPIIAPPLILLPLSPLRRRTPLGIAPTLHIVTVRLGTSSSSLIEARRGGPARRTGSTVRQRIQE